MDKVAAELASRGFSALFVDIGEDAATVTDAVSAREYTMPVLLDRDMRVARAYGVVATPTVVLVGRDGRILTTAVGPRPWTAPEGRALLQHLTEEASR